MGFMPVEEGLALCQAAAAYAGVGPVLEVGSYCGKSAIYLAAGARGAGSRSSPWTTIGARKSTSPAGSITTRAWSTRPPVASTPCRGLRATLVAAGLEDDVIAIVGRSADMARLWRTPLGMLFIDGGHTDAAAQRDYEGWAPWVADGGALAIHDVFPDPADGGQAPFRIYQRALASGAFTEVRHTGTLRVLERTAAGIG